MEVYLTRHARNRMRLYKIMEADVKTTLEAPGEIVSGASGSEHAWRQITKNQWLRVTFKIEGNRKVVITVTPKNRRQEGE